MKKAVLSLVFVFAFVLSNAQSRQQIIANETAFAKLYGYVKYFYPGDEAASINWDNFAIYGAEKVAGCANKEALKHTLHQLFDPIAPTLQLVDSNENIVFNKQSIIPPSLNGYKTIAWQHVGGQTRALNYEEDPFRSARTNRPIYLAEYSENRVSAPNWVDAVAYRNKKFVVKVRAKLVGGSGFALFYANVDLADKTGGFFKNTADNLLTTSDLTDFEIRGEVDSTGMHIGFGSMLSGSGELWIDNLSVDVQEGNTWKNIYKNDFNADTTGLKSSVVLRGMSPGKPNTYYRAYITEDPNNAREKWLVIKSKQASKQKVQNHTNSFKAYPKVGEYITKNIGGGLKIIMPIALYGTSNNTYPIPDAAKFDELKSDLNAVSSQVKTADSLTTRLANLVITWNVFQHFFPYFDVAKTDWTHDLRDAFANALDDKDGNDFLKTLRKFTAKLKDEHTRVFWGKDQNAYLPAINWEWIENKLVVTKVLDKSLPITKGDIITAIDNQTPKAYFENIEQFISAATPGGLTDRAQTETLLGGKGTSLQLSYLNHDNMPAQVSLIRKLTNGDNNKAQSEGDSVKQIDTNIIYLNIATVSGKTINKLLPQLKKSKAIICDLRNAMFDNWTTNHFIEYLLTKKDTAAHWAQTAHIIYPDQENISGYFTEGFDLVPAKPHLNAKIIFLVDATAYSWAESYISIIAHYKLATIVGQPTAGTNGDVKTLSLSGGYQIMFSGVKITQLDLSPHQGVGTKPDVYIAKTIKGIREGRDEFLEKAIEIANRVIE
ncbi:S41 family peptidase [Mucilaginibacter calamicampi]|uniref:S41 family peptidase n=1 Tax=Mucilaginibacter calamicampi TaxID=1302352 RepID=A0ABW2YYB4_9SPHI